MREKMLEISEQIRAGAGDDSITPSMTLEYIADCIDDVLKKKKTPHCFNHSSFAHDCPDCHALNPPKQVDESHAEWVKRTSNILRKGLKPRNPHFRSVICDCTDEVMCPQKKFSATYKCQVWVRKD